MNPGFDAPRAGIWTFLPHTTSRFDRRRRRRIRYNFMARLARSFTGGGHCPAQFEPGSNIYVENHICDARTQHSQQDINASLLKAMSEMTRQIKRLDDEVRRARRDAQISRRF
jgi:ribosome-associated translation inhibitor RaiA